MCIIHHKKSGYDNEHIDTQIGRQYSCTFSFSFAASVYLRSLLGQVVELTYLSFQSFPREPYLLFFSRISRRKYLRKNFSPHFVRTLNKCQTPFSAFSLSLSPFARAHTHTHTHCCHRLSRARSRRLSFSRSFESKNLSQEKRIHIYIYIYRIFSNLAGPFEKANFVHHLEAIKPIDDVHCERDAGDRWLCSCCSWSELCLRRRGQKPSWKKIA